MSAVRDPITGSWLVVSLRLMENRVKLCRTPRGPDASPAGPYTCDYAPQLPPPWDAKDYNTYAAKAHTEFGAWARLQSPSPSPSPSQSQSQSPVELSAGVGAGVGAGAFSGGVVVSVVSNPVFGPGELFGQPKHRAAYCPKFFLLEPLAVAEEGVSRQSKET